MDKSSRRDSAAMSIMPITLRKKQPRLDPPLTQYDHKTFSQQSPPRFAKQAGHSEGLTRAYLDIGQSGPVRLGCRPGRLDWQFVFGLQSLLALKIRILRSIASVSEIASILGQNKPFLGYVMTSVSFGFK
jgi:hypothetical protein